MEELPIDPNELDEYYPLSDIAEMLNGVTYDQLQRWAEKNRNNGFPEPIVLGKYKVYKRAQVIAWVTLWKRINKNFGSVHFKTKGE